MFCSGQPHALKRHGVVREGMGIGERGRYFPSVRRGVLPVFEVAVVELRCYARRGSEQSDLV